MDVKQLILLAALLGGTPPAAFAATQQNVKVTVNMRNVPLKSVLDKVEGQTNYLFIIGEGVDVTKRVTVNAKSTTLKKLLDDVLSRHGYSYELEGHHIIVSAGPKNGRRSTQEAPQRTGQKSIIKGKVTDARTGEPVIGASVVVKGTRQGGITDFDGNFTLEAPAGSLLTVSYVGFNDQDITAEPGKSLAVSLQESSQALNEVVVTALGIKKEAKALTYNVQEIKADEITGVKDANFMNSLAGKVAGVEINSASTGIGGSAKVVMRGTKSISGNNNALYVVDGIPLPSLKPTETTDLYTGMGQSGDGASMINPEDIESLSVLSGAAASALYGSEAANGVIMITTKKGKTGHLAVNYSNNTSFFSPFVLPEFQNRYGSEAGSFSSWGDLMKMPSTYEPKDFFQTGWNVNNSVTLSTGSENSQTFVSLSSTNAEGIVDNNKLARYNFAIRNSTDMLNDKLHMDLSAMYMNIREQNMLAQGQYFNPIVPIYLFPRGEDINKYKAFEHYNPERNFKTQYWPFGNQGIGMQNPWWITERDKFLNRKNRFILSGGLKYDIAKWINVSGRAKMDYTSYGAEKIYSASTDAIFAEKYGLYGRGNNQVRQLYGDFMVNIDKYFGDFSLTATLGTSIQDVVYHFDNIEGNIKSVANSFSLEAINTSLAKIKQDDYHDQVQAIFATAQIGWKSRLYLDLTARNDWSSALAFTNKLKKGIFYPSVGVSAIVTDLLPMIKSDYLNFMKIRASYSEVGNAPTRYIPNPGYPFEQANAVTQTTYPNPNLQPERTKSWEIGLQTTLVKNRINLNVSLYKTSTYNQLFNPTLSASSGYNSIYVNAGQVDNKGLEASLSVNQPLGPVNWTTSLVYTINRNTIKKMRPAMNINGLEIPESKELDMMTMGNVKVRLTEGGSMGDLYVTALRTDEHGYIDVDYTSKQVFVEDNKWLYAGNTSPKYTLGWRNNFEWKGLSLGFLINARVGGVVVSMTQAMMDQYGVSERTAADRDAGGALVNGYRIPAQSFWQTVGGGAGSYYVYSATNVRLAELTVGYDVPVTKWIPWIKGLHVAFTGRNLCMLYNKAPFDPELTASTGTYMTGMDYFMLPSLRNLGFSVKINF